jgi:hypothetical protein
MRFAFEGEDALAEIVEEEAVAANSRDVWPVCLIWQVTNQAAPACPSAGAKMRQPQARAS